MQLSIKQAFTSNSFLKVSSFIIGYIFWLHCGLFFNTTLWLHIPICFYNNVHNKHIQAPENIWVQLSGKRSILAHIDKRELAIYINAAELIKESNMYSITSKNLFLCPAVTLINYIPQNLKINVENS